MSSCCVVEYSEMYVVEPLEHDLYKNTSNCRMIDGNPA